MIARHVVEDSWFNKRFKYVTEEYLPIPKAYCLLYLNSFFDLGQILSSLESVSYLGKEEY